VAGDLNPFLTYYGVQPLWRKINGIWRARP
jgi:hypothetical protein